MPPTADAPPDPADAAAFHVARAGRGRPMVLVPGLACSGALWEATVAAFSATHETIVLTPAGFGGVPPLPDLPGPPPGGLLARWQAALTAQVDALDLRDAVLVGHSLGGFLALSVALRRPGRVGALVLVDAIPALGLLATPSARPDQLRRYADQYMRAPMLASPRAEFDARARRTVAGWVADPAAADRISGWGEASDQATVAHAMAEFWCADLRAELPALQAPTLLIAAPGGPARTSRETMLRGYALQFASAPPGRVTMRFAERARHFIMVDEPAWMHAEMAAFLAAHGGDPATLP